MGKIGADALGQDNEKWIKWGWIFWEGREKWVKWGWSYGKGKKNEKWIKWGWMSHSWGWVLFLKTWICKIPSNSCKSPQIPANSRLPDQSALTCSGFQLYLPPAAAEFWEVWVPEVQLCWIPSVLSLTPLISSQLKWLRAPRAFSWANSEPEWSRWDLVLYLGILGLFSDFDRVQMKYLGFSF